MMPIKLFLANEHRRKKQAMPQRKNDTENEKSTGSNKVLTIVGLILCIILIPILIINITLIIKSYINTDEVPKIGGYAPLIVLTGSMEDEIMEGDLIIVKQIDGADVKVNDIIAFFDPDGNGTSVLTHRVIEVINDGGELSFRTMGDANTTEDRTAVSADKLVGIYKFRIAGAGNVAMFMQTTAGLVVCVVVPLILLIGWDIIRRRRYEKRNQQDTSALLAELEALRAQKAVSDNAATGADRNAPTASGDGTVKFAPEITQEQIDVGDDSASR